MARFDVYRNPRRGSVHAPYLVDMQCDWLQAGLRVVVPLVKPSYHGTPISKLNPVVEVEGKPLVFSPTEIGSLPDAELRKPVASLAADRDVLVAALDFLFQGY
jgi:toxin CcdB